MPIVKKITLDMFKYQGVCDYMCNPCNLRGAAGAGLSAEFKRLVPSFYERYRELCFSNELRIGTIGVIDNTDFTWDMLLIPTKRHYADTSDPRDISRSLEALREFLLEEKNKRSVVCMPMLGCGLGAQDYPTVYPLMEQYLSDLEATVFICMSPDRTDQRPRYLTIAGPLDYGHKEEEKVQIETVIEKVLANWGMSLSDYEGVVSGGYPGIDAYVCGTHYGRAVSEDKNDVSYQDTYVYQKTDKLPLVCKPNTYRNGVGANLHLGNLLCEISEDIILFKPKGHNNNRLSNMQTWLLADKEERERQGITPRRVAVFGEIGIMRTPEDILVPQEADVPY